MKPALYRSTLPQGATWERRMTWKQETVPGSGVFDIVVALAAYTARMMVRPTYDGAVTVDISNGAGITLADTSPNIIVKMTPAQTRACVLPAGKVEGPYVADLELTPPNGDVIRLMDIKFNVTRESTRD